MNFDPGPCPVCGGSVDWQFECPGYNRKDGRVWVCMGGCDNAIGYYCETTDCTWWYREPNARHEPTMGVRPSWLDVQVEV